MTADVVSLDAERRNRRPAPGCEMCAARRDGRRCYPHQLAELATVLRQHDRDTPDALLIDRAHLDEAIRDALRVLDGITRECLTPTTERTTK